MKKILTYSNIYTQAIDGFQTDSVWKNKQTIKSLFLLIIETFIIVALMLFFQKNIRFFSSELIAKHEILGINTIYLIDFFIWFLLIIFQGLKNIFIDVQTNIRQTMKMFFGAQDKDYFFAVLINWWMPNGIFLITWGIIIRDILLVVLTLISLIIILPIILFSIEWFSNISINFIRGRTNKTKVLMANFPKEAILVLLTDIATKILGLSVFSGLLSDSNINFSTIGSALISGVYLAKFTTKNSFGYYYLATEHDVNFLKTLGPVFKDVKNQFMKLIIMQNLFYSILLLPVFLIIIKPKKLMFFSMILAWIIVLIAESIGRYSAGLRIEFRGFKTVAQLNSFVKNWLRQMIRLFANFSLFISFIFIYKLGVVEVIFIIIGYVILDLVIAWLDYKEVK
ncbi:MAG: hypothetical protein LBC17_03295 [Lactobacillaceae bacterium]|jgi:hypothetical protein|nr:hypothetical protein [Lactobacillaceae bacterium]